MSFPTFRTKPTAPRLPMETKESPVVNQPCPPHNKPHIFTPLSEKGNDIIFRRRFECPRKEDVSNLQLHHTAWKCTRRWPACHSIAKTSELVRRMFQKKLTWFETLAWRTLERQWGTVANKQSPTPAQGATKYFFLHLKTVVVLRPFLKLLSARQNKTKSQHQSGLRSWRQACAFSGCSTFSTAAQHIFLSTKFTNFSR